MSLKQDILNFVNHIKSTKNRVPFNSKLLQVPVKEFVKIVTQEFAIAIYRKGCSDFYVDPKTAAEYNLSAPPLFGTEIHNISRWVLSLRRLSNVGRKDALFNENICPEFTEYDRDRVTRHQRKNERQLLGLLGLYKSVSHLYKYGSKEDINRYELVKLKGEKFHFKK